MDNQAHQVYKHGKFQLLNFKKMEKRNLKLQEEFLIYQFQKQKYLSQKKKLKNNLMSG